MVLKISGFPTYRTNQIAVKGPARDVAGGVFALQNERDMDNLEVDYDNNVTDLYNYISNCQWNEALHTIASQPIEAKTWVVRYHEDENKGMMWRFLPLHSACARQPPLEIVQALIQVYPEGAQSPDDQGKYALHYACGNQASTDVIEALIGAFPTAARTSDPEGKLPLHWLAISGPDEVSAVEPLISASGKLYQIVDDEGWTSLDYAKMGEYPLQRKVVEALQKYRAPATTTSNVNQPMLPMGLTRNIAANKQKQVSGLTIPPEFTSHWNTHRSAPSGSRSVRSISTTATKGSINKTVARLNAQIVKLRAEENFKAAELEEQMVSLTEDHEEDMEETATKTHFSIEEKRKNVEDLASKEQFIKYKEGRISACDKEIYHFNDQNAKLVREITTAHDEVRMQKSILKEFELRIRTVLSKMSLMVEEQQRMSSNLASIEKDFADAADARRRKLHALLEDEMQEARETAELSLVYGKNRTPYGTASPTVRGGMKQQQEIMQSCAAVLDACDYRDDIQILPDTLVRADPVRMSSLLYSPRSPSVGSP